MKKIVLSSISILLFFILNFNAFSVQKTKIFGGDAGWSNLAETKNIEIGKGRFGNECLEIESNKAGVSDSTDLLINFDGGKIVDEKGNYTVTENNMSLTPKSAMGNGAALAYGSGLRLEPKENALFGRRGTPGSFAIEFWMAPANGENGENVFTWNSSRTSVVGVIGSNIGKTKNYSEYQMISCAFFNNHLEWSFSNIFIGYDEADVILHGKSTIVPEKWSRHSISFDEETGLIEYIVDGHVEDMRFITRTGHEGGTVCVPALGVTASIELCKNFSGRIDDFRIERDVNKVKDFGLYGTLLESYKRSGGWFSTEPTLIATGATLNSVNALMNVPEETSVRFFVRSGENYYNWTSSYPEWKEIENGAELSGVEGMYFQLKANLLCDGAGSRTPQITEIAFNYTEYPLPFPPFSVYADGGKNSITVTWNYSVDDATGGYYVYYGNRSGEYLGRAAIEGMSPIKAGNTTSFTLTGLESGSLYYFAVASYSKKDEKTIGSLSREVYARAK